MPDKIDFTTFGDQTSYIDMGAIRIQFGTKTGGKHNSNVSVDLPAAFADSNYTVSLCDQFNESGSSMWWAFIVDKTATSFNFRSGYTSGSTPGTNVNNVMNWIAIGLKPTS